MSTRDVNDTILPHFMGKLSQNCCHVGIERSGKHQPRSCARQVGRHVPI